MRLCRTPENENGFTILEVLFAISILTIGILAVASMQISSMRGNYFASNVSEATTWAGDQLERLMGLPYDDAELNDTDNDGASGLTHTGGDADYGPQVQGKYSVYWNVAVEQVFNNTKTINVIVTWSDRGDQSSLSVRHIKAD